MASNAKRLLTVLLALTLTLPLSMTVGADEESSEEYIETAVSDEANDDETSPEESPDDNNPEESESEDESEVEITDDELSQISVSDDFNVDDNKHQRQELQDENKELKEKITLTEREITEKKAQSEKLQKQISQLSSAIKISTKRIDTLNDSIVARQKIVDAKLEEIKDILSLLRARLRSVHLAGDTSSLEIILGARSFSDFLDKSEMVKSMSDHDNQLITSIQTQLDSISAEQEGLREDKKEVEAEKSRLEANRKTINRLLEENTRLIEELTAQQEALHDEQKENEEKQKELKKALSAYRRRQAQLEAERKKRQNDDSDEPEYVVTPDSDGSYVWPCPGFTYLTSTFDEWRGANNHGAIDIADAGIYGAKVVACSEGVVFSAWNGCVHDYGKSYSCGCGGGYGNYVMIDHGDGKISIYGHLSDVTVSTGDTVVGGQLIGYVGSTGYSTGPHLHFETQYNGVRYDPLSEY